MRRVALLTLPVFAVGVIVLAVVLLRRRAHGTSEALFAEPDEPFSRVDAPEPVGQRVEAPEGADADSGTGPGGVPLYEALRAEEEELRHGALQHLSTEPLAPKQV